MFHSQKTDRVKTEGVNMARELAHIAVVGARDRGEFPAGVTEGGHAAGEHVVVDEASVDRKNSHQQDDVAAIEKGLKNFAAVEFDELLLVIDQQECREEHQEAVANVSKHDRKQEREGDDGEGRGVNLAIGSNTVRINDSLEREKGVAR